MKIIIKRFIAGSIVGISISYLITLVISILLGDGNYYEVSPQLISTFGNEMNAMIIQTVASMLVGGMFSATSYIFDGTDYSITKQTIIHFLITTPVYLGVGYLLGWWQSNSLFEIFISLGIYILIYIVIWIAFLISWKHKVGILNKKINSIN